MTASDTPGVPRGWRLVPEDPTALMLSDAWNAESDGWPVCDRVNAPEEIAALGAYQRNFVHPRGTTWGRDFLRVIWSAMLSAAPTPPGKEG